MSDKTTSNPKSVLPVTPSSWDHGPGCCHASDIVTSDALISTITKSLLKVEARQQSESAAKKRVVRLIDEARKAGGPTPEHLDALLAKIEDARIAATTQRRQLEAELAAARQRRHDLYTVKSQQHQVAFEKAFFRVSRKSLSEEIFAELCKRAAKALQEPNPARRRESLKGKPSTTTEVSSVAQDARR